MEEIDMKREVGKWERKGHRIYFIDSKEKLTMYWEEEVDNVKDTPQELVQAGDLVDIELYKGCALTRIVVDVTMDSVWIDDGTFYDINDVIAILTPNKNKSVYTLQYKREEK